eukprot:TRINITY_DN7217_c0_g1_i6.p1 TRINITY_DN7217_c0_g1~~TRINITY_DN7217_c0_g1_i6.p1  ORF type:complete len:125 (+),score=0.86 TRINITY_DN7217_c0_g1_i6:103-477(+)
MGEGLIQPCRVREDGPTGRKPLLYGKKPVHVWTVDGTVRIRTGQLRASSRGNTEDASVIRNHWVQRVRRRAVKSGVKYHGSTVEVPLILAVLSYSGAAGICGVAVKCIDITQNTDREGRSLTVY